LTQVKSTTVFLRTALPTTDLVPLEFLELLDTLCFTRNLAAVAVPLIAAETAMIATATEAESVEVFPSVQINIADLLVKAPASAVARLAEVKTSLYFPKLSAIVAAALLRLREADACVAVCNDAVAEIRNRHVAVTQMEDEHLALVSQQAATAEAAAEAGGVLSPRHRSQTTLSRRIATLRRRVAFTKLRVLERQFDLPWHARIHELRAAGLFMLQRRAAALPAAAAVPSGPVPDAKGGAQAAKPPAKASNSTAAPGGKQKGDDAPKTTPRGGKAGDGVAATDSPAAEVELPLAEKLKVEAVEAATKAVVLFGRSFKWRCMFAALQGVINMVRVFYGAMPKSVLTDVLLLNHKAKAFGGVDMSASVATSVTVTPVPASRRGRPWPRPADRRFRARGAADEGRVLRSDRFRRQGRRRHRAAGRGAGVHARGGRQDGPRLPRRRAAPRAHHVASHAALDPGHARRGRVRRGGAGGRGSLCEDLPPGAPRGRGDGDQAARRGGGRVAAWLLDDRAGPAGRPVRHRLRPNPCLVTRHDGREAAWQDHEGAPHQIG
jgi:hypothetical protein